MWGQMRRGCENCEKLQKVRKLRKVTKKCDRMCENCRHFFPQGLSIVIFSKLQQQILEHSHTIFLAIYTAFSAWKCKFLMFQLSFVKEAMVLNIIAISRLSIFNSCQVVVCRSIWRQLVFSSRTLRRMAPWKTCVSSLISPMILRQYSVVYVMVNQINFSIFIKRNGIKTESIYWK